MKAATWHFKAMFQPQLAGKAKLWHTGSGSRGKWWGAMAALLQKEREGLSWRGALSSFYFGQPGLAAPLSISLLLGPKLSGE